MDKTIVIERGSMPSTVKLTIGASSCEVDFEQLKSALFVEQEHLQHGTTLEPKSLIGKEVLYGYGK
jgi:hypothetical protein